VAYALGTWLTYVWVLPYSKNYLAFFLLLFCTFFSFASNSVLPQLNLFALSFPPDCLIRVRFFQSLLLGKFSHVNGRLLLLAQGLYFSFLSLSHARLTLCPLSLLLAPPRSILGHFLSWSIPLPHMLTPTSVCRFPKVHRDIWLLPDVFFLSPAPAGSTVILHVSSATLFPASPLPFRIISLGLIFGLFHLSLFKLVSSFCLVFNRVTIRMIASYCCVVSFASFFFSFFSSLADLFIIGDAFPRLERRFFFSWVSLRLVSGCLLRLWSSVLRIVVFTVVFIVNFSCWRAWLSSSWLISFALFRLH